MKEFDFLVIGGGIAGLSFALEVAKHGRVAVLFKKGLSESSTAWAQGGIAAVSEADDNFDLHIHDTLVAGAGICNEEIVNLVVQEGPARIQKLIELGTHFDLMPDSQKYHLHKEGGHSKRRIFHAADATGYEIQRALLAATSAHSQIEIFPFSTSPNRVLGAYVLCEDQSIEIFSAPRVLVATGGAGKVYLYTSNPDVATGDGIAMCHRAGVSVANMEFFQFHPTCLFHPKAKNFLITEAMRGEGAYLLRAAGTRFMPDYDPRAELAPRDIVARAIDYEMKSRGDECVYLDITHRGADFIKQHFPTIYERCLSFGIDITQSPIPVVPAAHYCCGGVVSDRDGATSVAGLYVAGECAHTGLHGANRLASNSLLEGVVFGYRAAQHASSFKVKVSSVQQIPAWDAGNAVDSDEQVVITQNWEEIRRFMWNYVGIVRTNKRLQRALRRCELIKSEIEEYYWNFTVTSDLLELRNLCLVAELVIRCALSRKESRGLHYNLDYPATSDGDQSISLV